MYIALGLYGVANIFMIFVIATMMDEMKEEGTMVKHVLTMLLFLPCTAFCLLMFSFNGMLEWVAFRFQKLVRSSRLLNFKLFGPRE